MDQFLDIAIWVFMTFMIVNAGVYWFAQQDTMVDNGLAVAGITERTDFACSTTGICFPLLVLALLLSIAMVVGIGVTAGRFGGQSSVIIFAIGLMVFTYLYWVPVELTAMVVLIGLGFMAMERRQ